VGNTEDTIRLFATVDHKELRLRYLATAVAFLIVGGIEALFLRLQLARSELAFLSPEAYNQIFTMHGVTVIFWNASPILSGVAVCLVPLMIGAADGISTPECIYLLDVPPLGNISLSQSHHQSSATAWKVRHQLNLDTVPHGPKPRT
jgi:hypothetical protein